jgi:transcriptional regulator GlxA family with amidase domain
MHIAILTFEGYNELDSLIALGVLNRIKTDDWRVTIATPTPKVTSMNGVVIEQMSSLEEACAADAVIVGSGIATREVVEDAAIMTTLRRLDPSRQLVAGQCSGALVLARLGLLDNVPACTDLTTKPWVIAAGVDVLNQPFFAKGNIATAGGCLASHYLAAWIITRLVGKDAAESALHYVAPVGEKEEYIERAWRNIAPYLPVAEPALIAERATP